MQISAPPMSGFALPRQRRCRMGRRDVGSLIRIRRLRLRLLRHRLRSRDFEVGMRVRVVISGLVEEKGRGERC